MKFPAFNNQDFQLPVGRSHSPARGRATALLACAILHLICPHAAAQSATNFDTKKITPSSPSSRKVKAAEDRNRNAATAPKDAGPVSATPSRYVGEADMQAYLQSQSTVFSMRERATDPFGQLQDPDAKPVIKTTVAKATRRIAPAQSFPFSDIINMIKINTVMTKEKQFLVGTRSFREGGRMSLSFRTKTINVEILTVSARQIDFRNLESGETAALKINLLPVGMTPGTSGITAPGMVRDQQNAPIELESNISPEDTELNR